jgi:hypothetical protein
MPVIVAAMVKIVANVFRKMYETLDANENGLIILSDAIAAVGSFCMGPTPRCGNQLILTSLLLSWTLAGTSEHRPFRYDAVRRGFEHHLQALHQRAAS